MPLERKRILFKKDFQSKFLEYCKNQSGLLWKDLYAKIGVSGNTVMDYRKEKLRMPLPLFRGLCRICGESEKKMLSKFCGKKVEWKVEKPVLESAQKNFGKKRVDLEKGRITFKNNKYEIAASESFYSLNDKKQKIELPNRTTPMLAEEVGIHLGDGFLSRNKYEFRVKGDKKNERAYYKGVIKNLYKELFNIDLRLKEYKTSFGFEFCSKAIWNFKTKSLGLQAGKKDNIKIPEKLKINDSNVLAALIRGLFDTDGNIYFRSQGKRKNYYPRISLSSKSQELIKDMKEILEMLGLKPKTYNKRKYPEIVLNGYGNFWKFQEVIGFHNPKHLKKIETWGKKYKELGMAAMV